jgi:rRNA maturation RNase YbeY
VIHDRGGEPGAINYIFCSDDYLHQINLTYLGHDTYTDIVTFPYGEFPVISGDLFISTERVRENAETYGQPYTDELQRVMIHGILHLCGQGDKTEEDSKRMRELEQHALDLRTFDQGADAGAGGAG